MLVIRGKVHCDPSFLTVFILTHPVNFPCGWKPEHPEKTHDFRQSVDWLFSHGSIGIARIKPTISEVKGACSDEWRLRHWSPTCTRDSISSLRDCANSMNLGGRRFSALLFLFSCQAMSRHYCVDTLYNSTHLYIFLISYES
jgi:hypothetical protein